LARGSADLGRRNIAVAVALTRRHRRRPPGQWIPGVVVMALGVFFQIANLDPLSGVWFGPLVVIGLGAVSLLTSFGAPPRKDF
jgi:hypothetical protein